MKLSFRTLVVSLLFAVAVFYFIGCSSTPPVVSPGTKDGTTPSYPEKRDSEKTIASNTKYSKINIRYPVFSGQDVVNKRIENIVIERKNLFETNAEVNWKELNAMVKNSGTKEDAPPLDFDVSYETASNNANYVSVLLKIYSFEGGAHGYTNLVSVNYDKKQKKFISIPDIDGYSYKNVSEICRADLKKQFAKDLDATWIDDGAAPTADNFNIFTYDGKTLTVYFEQYQVAPYAYGIQKVSIRK